MKPVLLLLSLLALAGCATVQRTGGGGEAIVPSSHYTEESGRDPATVAQMRATPAPATPEVIVGKHANGDTAQMASQGFVKIGTGHWPGMEADVRIDAVRQGEQVGAEKILLYPPSAADASMSSNDWLALYFVRFKLPFGATFRDLRAQERTQLADGASGGVAIGSVIGGTPASRANLVGGDIVLQVDGKPISDRAAFQAMLKANAGRSVKLTIVRNGETLVRVVKLGAMQAGG